MTEATPADDNIPQDSASKADTHEDDASKPDASKPDASKPDASKPDGETGTSLAPASSEPSGVDPFIAAAAEAPATPEPRSFYAKALDYGAHAAMIVGLVGFAWTVSGHVVTRHSDTTSTPVRLADTGTATPSAKPTETPAPAKVDELGDLRKSNQSMASEIRNLHASLEALRTTVVRERSTSSSSGADVRALQASLDNLKSSLSGTRSEQSAAIAQLSAKVERLQREERPPQPVAVAKPEHRDLDTATTASIAPVIPPKAVPTPPAKPTVLASAEPEARETDDADKPQLISGWVVRDVYQGVALIEGRRGQMEVVPGVSIPGAGTVKSIARHGGAWTVTTTRGQFASAAPQHEPHRSYQRDYYGPSRWGY